VVSELALTGRMSMDTSGLRLSRFTGQPAQAVEAIDAWWNVLDRTREAGTRDVVGVRIAEPSGTCQRAS
jgi:hypothetical protein